MSQSANTQEESRRGWINYLGLDWGASKVGVALAHAETRIAVACGIWPNDVQLFTVLRSLIEKETVGILVIGVPKRRGESGSKHAAQVFGQKLEQSLKIPIVLVDEMFTSKLAQDILRARGEHRVAAHDDAEAAKILLQDWLDRQAVGI